MDELDLTRRYIYIYLSTPVGIRCCNTYIEFVGLCARLTGTLNCAGTWIAGSAREELAHGRYIDAVNRACTRPCSRYPAPPGLHASHSFFNRQTVLSASFHRLSEFGISRFAMPYRYRTSLRDKTFFSPGSLVIRSTHRSRGGPTFTELLSSSAMRSMGVSL